VDYAGLTDQELCELLEVRLFGKTLVADTPAKIGQAVFSGFWSNEPVDHKVSLMTFKFNGAAYRIESRESRFGYGGALGNDGYGLWFWENRQGQP
jgi:hypothetical protein